ncbi:MAG: tetratricopeptide repeat protein [Phycisphaerae bacterium]|jgi:tetratricopeptide (TPR) repeat protein|nr:tetratricopeptide repeat protein [Phycisphaerae bacterium]
MNKWIGLTVLVIAISGCIQKPLSESRVDSFDRWCKARARIFCGMAEQDLQAGRLVKARKKADQAVELAPKFAEARMVLGRIRMEQDAYVSAIAELQEACRLDEESTQAQYLLGVAHEKAGHIQHAVDAYKKAYELAPKNIDAVMAVGEVLAINGRAAEGSKYVEEYLSGSRREKPAMLELAGRLALCARQYELAAKHYLTLTRRDGDNANWREELSRALFAHGQFARASDALEARVSIVKPKAPAWVYAMLGDCYTAVSRPTQARIAYSEALSRQPDSAPLMVKTAQAHFALGDSASAGKIARKALHIAPGGLDATLVLGYSLLREKKPLEAERILGPAVMLHPKSVTLLCLLGRCHAAAGDSDEAMNCYRQAVKLDPECEVARKLFDRLEQEISANTAD